MSEPWSFEGKVCVVTGAAQGVGEATARLMAARGAAALALLDRQGGKLAEVAASISAAFCPAMPITTELGEVEACFAAIDGAAGRFGALHALVNAGALTDRGTIDDTTPEFFDRMFAVNARAPFFLTQRVLPWLRRAGGGTIVNITSVNVHCGAPFLTAYTGAKAALAAMTKNIGNAVGRDRVRVNAINLGWTLTTNERQLQMDVHGRAADWPEQVGATLPFGRLLLPEDAARLICFLASDESALMNGAVIDFDQQVMGGFATPR